MADNSHPDSRSVPPGFQASSDQSVASTSPPRIAGSGAHRAVQAEKQVDWENYTASMSPSPSAPWPTKPNGMHMKYSNLTALLMQYCLNDDRLPTGDAGFTYAEAIIVQDDATYDIAR